MKKNAVIFLLTVFIAVLYAGCATAGPRESSRPDAAPAVEVLARAFIDFSGYTGPSPLPGHQPEQHSDETRGPFTLENGITGDCLRVSHVGDRDIPVLMENFGNGIAAYNNNFMYFYIDNFELREATNLTMNVTFFDEAVGAFIIHYAGSSGENPNYVPISVSMRGRRNFSTATVQLVNCNFNGGVQNQGAQFRFNSASRIQKVELLLTSGGPAAGGGRGRQQEDDGMYWGGQP